MARAEVVATTLKGEEYTITERRAGGAFIRLVQGTCTVEIELDATDVAELITTLQERGQQ